MGERASRICEEGYRLARRLARVSQSTLVASTGLPPVALTVSIAFPTSETEAANTITFVCASEAEPLSFTEPPTPVLVELLSDPEPLSVIELLKEAEDEAASEVEPASVRLDPNTAVEDCASLDVPVSESDPTNDAVVVALSLLNRLSEALVDAVRLPDWLSDALPLSVSEFV